MLTPVNKVAKYMWLSIKINTYSGADRLWSAALWASYLSKLTSSAALLALKIITIRIQTITRMQKVLESDAQHFISVLFSHQSGHSSRSSAQAGSTCLMSGKKTPKKL